MKTIFNKRITILILVLFILFVWSASTSNAVTTHIKVAVNCNLPPFQFLDENGTITGLHVEIMDQIAEWENLNVEYIIYNKDSLAIAALEDGSVDAVLGMLPGDSSNPSLRSTQNISSASLCMLVGNENIQRVLHPEMDPRRYTVAFEIGTLSLSQLSQMNTLYRVLMGDQTRLYNALANGQVDAVIGVKESMIYQLEHKNGNDSYTIVHNYIDSVDYSIMTRANDHVLYNAINRSINRLRASETYEELVHKWIGSIELEAVRAMTKKMLTYIVIFLGTAVIVIANIGYMNYRLKKSVAEKTSEIRNRVEQLETESALRDRLIECSPGGILLLKADGAILMMNSIARSLGGMEQFDGAQPNRSIESLPVLGELWQRMTAAEASAVTSVEASAVTSAVTSVEASVESPAASLPTVVRLHDGSGANRIFRVQCHSINAGNDKVLMVEDITREEEEKQERFELQKSKSLNRVIAGMAHEIKNPLMSIRTFASLIPKQGNDADFQTMFAQHVPNEVERINRLIEMLINYTRPPRSQKERVLVSEIIDDAAYFAHIYANNHQVSFQIHASLQAYIYANRDQLKQALINLIMNSVQSVEEKISTNLCDSSPLTIRVSIYLRQNQIYIEVYDEGCGMSDHELEKCIEPFFTTKPTGLGMGLAITRQFVQENGGKLEFQSAKDEFTKIYMIFEEDKAE